MNRLKDIKVKVCGMRDSQNIKELFELAPDYMGIIFWAGSKRFVNKPIQLTKNTTTKLIGVFVDESIEVILKKVHDFKLDGIQLHGKETAEFCQKLKTELSNRDSTPAFIIKAFSVDESFDFSSIESYSFFCDYFLFDTKGIVPGGTGKTFSWKLLADYQLNTPYFLSGGISEKHLNQLIDFFESKASKHCVAIDLNSKFEQNIALKDIGQLKRFIKTIQQLS